MRRIRPAVSEGCVRPDEELVPACQAGDGPAWEALVKRHQDRVLNLAYQFTGNRDEARDLAQEIFVRLYLRLDQYDPARPFRFWFNSLARNLCIDHYRSRREKQRLATVALEATDRIVATSPSPDQQLARREERDLILAALDALSAISREAIVLKDLQEMTLEEIAQSLDLPIGTVKSRVFRARIELGRAILRRPSVGAVAGGGVGLP
jgi:RNA polymerase sigma-70 factor (ECF subfamily)